MTNEKRGNYTRALDALSREEQRFPEHRVLHLVRGRILAKSGQLPLSIEVLSSAAARWPNDSELQVALGNALLLDSRVEVATSHFRRALALDSGNVPAIVGLANALREIGMFEEASHHLETAIKHAPQSPEIFDNLGLLLQDMGQLNASIRMFEKALAITPHFANAQLHLGISKLLGGEFEEGWRGYEMRFATTTPPVSRAAHHHWKGQPIGMKKLLIWSEQGLGDEIMFVSCLLDVQRQAQNITLECSPKLVTLYERSFPNVDVIPKSIPPGSGLENDETYFSIPVASLGALFRKSRTDFPSHRGYLAADQDKRTYWKNALSALGNGLKVGIAWSGGTRSTRQTLRSIPLQDWTRLLNVTGVHFISLQHTTTEQELATAIKHIGVKIHHWQNAIDDYDETAALVSELDLIISVQTAVVHLAGALGKTTWVMVPVCPEWRYLREGTTMPWYPSVKLFRQRNRHEWHSVLADIELTLVKSLTENK